jgi:hypothetical protein
MDQRHESNAHHELSARVAFVDQPSLDGWLWSLKRFSLAAEELP